MEALSAEAAVRQLRSPVIPHSERLAVAVAVWRNDGIVIPRKDRFLLEWLSKELVGSTERGEAALDGAPQSHGLPALFNAGSWALFHDIITQVFGGGARSSSSATFTANSANIVVNPSILAPLAVAYVACLPRSAIVSSVDEVHRTDAKRRKNETTPSNDNDTLAAVDGPLLAAPLLACLRSLLGRTDVFVPTYEAFVSFVETMLHARLRGDHGARDSTGADSDDLFAVALNAFADVQRQHANRRKVFAVFTARLLTPLLVLRDGIVSQQSHQSASTAHSRVLTIVSALITNALFHKDHIAEYASALSAPAEFVHGVVKKGTPVGGDAAGDKKKPHAVVVSYPRQLFDHLRAELAPEGGVALAPTHGGKKEAAMHGRADAPVAARKRKADQMDSDGGASAVTSAAGVADVRRGGRIPGARDAVMRALPVLLEGFLAATQTEDSSGQKMAKSLSAGGAQEDTAAVDAEAASGDDDVVDAAADGKARVQQLHERARDAAEAARSFKRRVRFCVFLELCGMLGVDAPAVPLAEKVGALHALDTMLALLLSRGVYSVGDDNRDGQPQFRWFSSLLGGLLRNWQSDVPATPDADCLAAACRASDAVALQIDACVTHLLYLNHAIIEPHLVPLWRVVAAGCHPLPSPSPRTPGVLCERQCFRRTLSCVFATYVKLRRIDALCQSMLDAVVTCRASAEGAETLARLFGAVDFQREFADAVRRVPVGLLATVWGIFIQFLTPVSAHTNLVSAKPTKSPHKTKSTAAATGAGVDSALLPAARLFSLLATNSPLSDTTAPQFTTLVSQAREAVVEPLLRELRATEHSGVMAPPAVAVAEASLCLSAALISAQLLLSTLSRDAVGGVAAVGAWASLAAVAAGGSLATLLLSDARSAHSLRLAVVALAKLQLTTEALFAHGGHGVSAGASPSAVTCENALDVLVRSQAFASGTNAGAWKGTVDAATDVTDDGGPASHDSAAALWVVASNLSLVLALAEKESPRKATAVDVVAKRFITAIVDGKHSTTALTGGSNITSVGVTCRDMAIAALLRADALESRRLQRSLVGHVWSRVAEATAVSAVTAEDEAGCIRELSALAGSIDWSTPPATGSLESLASLVGVLALAPVTHLPAWERSTCVAVSLLSMRAALAGLTRAGAAKEAEKTAPATKKKQQQSASAVGAANYAAFSHAELVVRGEAVRRALRIITRVGVTHPAMIHSAIRSTAVAALLRGVEGLGRALDDGGARSVGGDERKSLRTSLLRRLGKLVGGMCRDAIVARVGEAALQGHSGISVEEHAYNAGEAPLHALGELLAMDGGDDTAAEIVAVVLGAIGQALAFVSSHTGGKRAAVPVSKAAADSVATARALLGMCARIVAGGVGVSGIVFALPQRHALVRCMAELLKSQMRFLTHARGVAAGADAAADGTVMASLSQDVLRECSRYLRTGLTPQGESACAHREAISAAVAYLDAACHALPSDTLLASAHAGECLAADVYNLVRVGLLHLHSHPWLLHDALNLFASYVSHSTSEQLARVAEAVRVELEKASGVITPTQRSARSGQHGADAHHGPHGDDSIEYMSSMYSAAAALRCATVLLTLPLPENRRQLIKRHIMPLCAVIPSVVSSFKPSNDERGIQALALVTCPALEAVEAAATFEGMDLRSSDVTVAMEALVASPLFGAASASVAAMASGAEGDPSALQWLRAVASDRRAGDVQEDEEDAATARRDECVVGDGDAIEAFVFRCYRVLRALLRRHSDPVYAQIHVFAAAVRHRFGASDDDDVDASPSGGVLPGGARCVENLSRLLQELSSHKAASSKYAPYLVADYLEWTQRRPLPPALRQGMQSGLYALLDMCTEHEDALLMATADPPSRALLQSLHADFTKYHKYTGKV